MNPPTWNTDRITLTDTGNDVISTLDTDLFFADHPRDIIDDAEDHGLTLLDEGTYRLVFTDPTNTHVTGDAVIKLRKNQSGCQMNQTEYYGRDNAPDWLRPYLVPALGTPEYVVMPRCDTDSVPQDAYESLREHIDQHAPEIATHREFHHKNIGLYNNTPVIFDYAVGFNL